MMLVANPTDTAVDANDIAMPAMTLARAQKMDVTTIAGTAPTTAGFIDIKGADGNVFVRQATASNLNMTEASAASSLTSLQLIDDTVFTDDTSTHATGTSKGIGIMAVATPTDANVDANDIGMVAMTLSRNLKVDLAGSAANSTAGLLSVKVDQTTPGTTNAIALSTLGANAVATGNGASSTGVLRVAQVNDGTGVIATVSTVTSVTQNADVRQATASNFNAQVVGNIAHDGVDSGNPILNGYRAISHGANPTAVASADRTYGYANIAGIPFVMGGHPNIVSGEYNTTAAQTDDNILPAIAGGTIYVITSVSVMVSNACTVSPSVRIGFGAATLTASGASGADAVSKIILSHPGIAPGSGIVKGTGSGIVGIGGDGEELRITCSVPTTGSIFVQVDYYTIAS